MRQCVGECCYRRSIFLGLVSHFAGTGEYRSCNWVKPSFAGTDHYGSFNRQAMVLGPVNDFAGIGDYQRCNRQAMVLGSTDGFAGAD